MLRCLPAVLVCLLVSLYAAPSGAATRVLVVYPFAVSGSADEAMGKQISDKIGAELKALGGVEVVNGAATTKPADYRSAAQTAGADFYFSGSIVPVFTSYSAIEHLVSTRTGTVMWSVTIHFKDIAEVVGEGQRVRAELLRGDQAPKNIAPAAASPATPPAAGAPAVAALGTPRPQTAGSGYAVLPTLGTAIDGDRQFATRVIVETLTRRGYKVVTVTGLKPIDAALDGPEACATTGAQTLIAGALDTTRVAPEAGTPQTTARISLRTYDCRAHALEIQPIVVNHIAPIANDAIRGSIEDAVSAFPSPS